MEVKFYYMFYCLLNAAVGNASLRQLHVIFRHGERTPTETYPNDPYINYTWPEGWGHLTNVFVNWIHQVGFGKYVNRGKLQIYTLGLKLRELYPDLIPTYYFPAEVKVMSSYSHRCLMSAEALLAGLFPPQDQQVWNKDLLWQPIPVHYVPRNQDNLIAMKAACKNYDEELSRILKSGEVQNINDDNEEIFKYLTQHTGEKIDDIGDVEFLYNTLEIELLHNLTLPIWTRNVSLDQMKVLAARSLKSFTETDSMKRLKGGVFLKKVLTSMEQIEKDPVILFLYSGHDITLVNILNTLGYPSILKPGFGASFIIELHNNTQVQMKYRNDVFSTAEEIVFKECNSCTLSAFKDMLEPLMPVDWNEECNQ